VKRIAQWLLLGSVAAVVLLLLSWVGWLAYEDHSYHKSFPAYVFVSVRPYTWEKGTPAVEGFVGNPEFGFWDGGEGTAVAIRVSEEDAHRFKLGCIVGSDYSGKLADGEWLSTADLTALVIDVDQNVVTLLVDQAEPTHSQLISAFRKGCVRVGSCG